MAPVCKGCGGYYVPGGGSRSGPPMYGNSSIEARALRGLGFVAFLTSEQGAVALLGKVNRFLGFTYPYRFGKDGTAHAFLWDRIKGPARHYEPAEIKALSDEILAADAETAARGYAADEDPTK